MCIRTWWPPTQTYHNFVTGGSFSRGEIVLGCSLYLGHLVLGSFFPMWLVDRGSYGLVALCPEGFWPGTFDIKPYIFSNHTSLGAKHKVEK